MPRTRATVEQVDFEYSTLVVRDVGDAPHDRPWLEEDFLQGSPGTLAIAGSGWLHAATRAETATVTIEVLSAEPPRAADAWPDVMETPYVSGVGAVGVMSLMSWDPLAVVDLPPGPARVRVHRRTRFYAHDELEADEADRLDEWLLQLWPVERLELPRHLAREPRVLDEGPRAPREWRSGLPWAMTEVLDGVITAQRAHARPVSLEEIALPLDRPLHLPVGDPEGLDYAEEAVLEAAAARGLPLGTWGDALTFFIEVGLVQRSAADPRAFMRASPPPALRDVVPALAGQLPSPEDDDDFWEPLAIDIASLVAWTPGGELQTSISNLADRLLVQPQDVRNSLSMLPGVASMTIDDHDAGG